MRGPHWRNVTVTVPGKPPAKRFPAFLAIMPLTVAVIALAYGLYLQSGRWLVASWQGQLETAPEGQAAILIDRLAQMEESGFPALVQALDSPRECVARMAKRRLWAEIDQWEELRTREASRRAVCLAQTLADQVESLGPDGQKNAVDLAARILAWPVDDEIVRARHVMAACEQVIRTSGLPRPTWSVPSRVEQSGQPNAEGVPPMESARRATVNAEAQDGEIRQLTYLSGGGLPTVSPLISPAEGEPAGESSPGMPAKGTGGAPDAAQPADARGPKSPGQPVGPEPAHLDPPAGGRPLGKAATAVGADLLRQGLAPLQNREGDLNKKLLLTDTLELMRRLRSENAESADAARQELQRRGFTEVHLELAKQMFDPDPEVRRQLARMLPELRSVHSTPWLVWLCHDRDAEVRLLAITLLATTNDPTVLAEVERIARTDEDSRIQDQALRLARHRGEGQPSRSRR